jgi:UDP-glucose 4-epimerase
MERPVRFAVCGAGFIGQNLIDRLLSGGDAVSVLDRKPAPQGVGERVHWVEGSFGSQDDLRRALAGSDVAFHLVSTTVPGDDHVTLLQELADNISATMRFLDVCGEMGVRRIVFASSSSVYGLQQDTPIAESAQTTPISSHGIHKLTLEKYLLLRQFEHGTDVRIVRLSNPYGPGQKLTGRQGFLAIAIGRLLSGQTLLMRGHGSPIRDFIYIGDVCDALIAAAVAETPPAVMNIGTGVGHSLAAAVAEIADLTGVDIATEDGQLRKADIPESVLDIRLARETLGFEPAISLREGLAQTLRYHGVELRS